MLMKKKIKTKGKKNTIKIIRQFLSSLVVPVNKDFGCHYLSWQINQNKKKHMPELFDKNGQTTENVVQ